MIRRPPRSTLFPTRRSSDLTVQSSPITKPYQNAPNLRRNLIDPRPVRPPRSEEHTSELQSRFDLVCRLLLEKKKNKKKKKKKKKNNNNSKNSIQSCYIRMFK